MSSGSHNNNNSHLPPQPIYTTDLLPCAPVSKEVKAGASKKLQVESKTYKDLVAQKYILFQDTDVVRGQGSAFQLGSWDFFSPARPSGGDEGRRCHFVSLGKSKSGLERR